MAELAPHTGRVLLRSHPLFTTGARVGAEVRLKVRCVPSGSQGTALVVVTWNGTEPEVVSIHSADLDPGVHELRAVLVGVGRVRFVEPASVRPDPRTWQDLVRSIPAQLDTLDYGANLICGVELGGSPHEVGLRVALLQELIELLADTCPEPERFRVAVVGYGDHRFDSRDDHGSPVRGRWLSSANEALQTLEKLTPTAQSTPHAAPVEDMLDVVAGKLTRSPPGRRTVLLTVGSRPPHPAQVSENPVLPCPFGHRWDSLLSRITRDSQLSRIAVVDQVRPRDRFWQRLGADGLQQLAKADPLLLGTQIGIVVPDGRMLAFPLINENRDG